MKVELKIHKLSILHYKDLVAMETNLSLESFEENPKIVLKLFCSHTSQATKDEKVFQASKNVDFCLMYLRLVKVLIFV